MQKPSKSKPLFERLKKVFSNPLGLLPGLVVLFGVLCISLKFNGLYGQDAHEYLRQSRAVFGKFFGEAYAPSGIGDAEFAIGYPLAGALLRFFVSDSALALQSVSLLAAGFALWFFERNLARLHLGTRAGSRVGFAILALGCAPVFVRSGMSCMADSLGLACVLAAFFFGLKFWERENPGAFWKAIFAAALAIVVRFSAAPLVFPLVAALGWKALRRGLWAEIVAGMATGVVAVAPHFWLKIGTAKSPLAHSLLAGFSPLNLFRSEFQTGNGAISFALPNGLTLLFPFCHPGFFLLLPMLFWLVKRTDFQPASKRILLICSAFYLFFIGCLPVQNVRYLLPAYALLLLILFPAWDRFWAYGFYFLKEKWMRPLLVVCLVVQILATAKTLSPTLSRNRLERELARAVRETVPPGSTIFSFDVDLALRSALPPGEFFIQNLWEQRYENPPPGSFVLFNESGLRAQWAGRNPMLNFDFFREKHGLRVLRECSEGWKIYVFEH